jgi:cobalt-zinc-cadmium efflux system membrane fusion protein
MKKHSFITWIVLPLMLPMSLAILASCREGGQNSIEVEEIEVLPDDIVELREDQIKLAGIEFGSIETRSLGSTLNVRGTVTTSPQGLATVCLPMGGFVTSTSLLEGSAVSKGQTLAIIENQDFIDIQKDYLEAVARLEFSEAEFRRHSELFKEEVYSQESLQQVTAEYKSLKTQVKALEQKLSLIGIRSSDLKEENIRGTLPVVAPISGYIQAVHINIGKYVAPSDVMFEIVSSDHLLLELTLFEQDADKIAQGQNIRFFVNNETEEHLATIYQTGKSISADKTVKALARIQGHCSKVLPGMYVRAVIETSSDRKVTCLPSESIVSFDDKDYIFVFEQDKEEDGKPFTEYRMIEVRKGFTDNGYTEILLPDGFDHTKARAVTKGAYNLLSAKKNAGEMAC